MTLASLIPLVIKTSIVLMVFSLGLQASVNDLLSLRRTPALLLRSLLAMNVIMGVGMIVKHVAPAFAERAARPLSLVATVSLIAVVIPMLFSTWPALVSLIGNGTLAAFAAFIAVGLAADHLLGGPDPADRTVLTLSTAARHPGVALAIASTSFPEEKLVLPAVLLYLIAGTILSIPYLQWRRRKVNTLYTRLGTDAK